MKSINYETLASLPLFMGTDGATLSSFCEAVRPIMLSVRPGSVVVARGEECRMLTIVVEGEMLVTSADAKGTYTLEELIYGNNVVEPQRLFGLHPVFERTYTARTACKTLRLPKHQVVSQLFGSEVFRFNFLNMVCSAAQQAGARLANISGGTVESRLASFVVSKSLRPVGAKTLRIRMTDLARYIATSRLTLSRTLHSLEKRELIEMHRNSIMFPALERFVSAVR